MRDDPESLAREAEMEMINELIDRYIAAWNETDALKRRDLIAKTWTEDGVYVDPRRRGDGHEQLSTMIQGVQEHFPGYRFRRAGDADAHNDCVRFRWEAGGMDGAPLFFAGTDFGVIDTDGRFRSVTGFTDAAPGLKR